ncbi:inactive pancreatic lipase-related protein 1-like [Oppia nitens]|uniref:inactive pancreatic lipase-related protein 1-like n=1 Tax=Oppia nitens TaxID=1686743 RepID=UPI0023DC0F4D|nr:inactive pancreatic lipase-related protein 1-like [Oppia nitens]
MTITEATDNDIKYELLGSRSNGNLSLNYAMIENNYYLTKTAINSNIVKPSSDTTTETGSDKPKKVTAGSQLLVRCYHKYGCFSIAEPFLSIYRPINLFPISPDLLNVEFLLKTRKNMERSKKIVNKNDGTYDLLDFSPKNDLKIIIHGYLENGFQSWIKDMSIELLTKSDFNVICIDWIIGATPPYTQAVANARLVGAIIAHFIKDIQRQYPDYLSSKIHLIGHSLGAHIAGYVGKRIPGIARITGLDPAEPYFQNTDPRVRLDKSDALFVDVIHTDASSIITGGFGMSQGCGHIDFYPNGGLKQPGCSETSLKTVIDSIGKERNVIHGIRKFIGCNHIRAFLLFTESINTDCPFMAYQCSSYEEFASGLCTKGKNSCLSLSRQSLDNNSYDNTSTSIDCFHYLQMGFNAYNSWVQLNNYINSKPLLMKELGVNKGHEDTGHKFFLQTSHRTPYCFLHYHIQLTFKSDINTHFQEKGRLFVQLFGTKGSTQVIDATKDTPLSDKVEYIISASDIGTVIRVEIQLKYSPSLVINPLRWRLSDSNDSNQLYLNKLIVVNLENGYKYGMI